jgi:hypothetical protein
MYFNKFNEVRGKLRRNLQDRVSRRVLKTTILQRLLIDFEKAL